MKPATRLVSLLLAAGMMASLVPASAFAVNTGGGIFPNEGNVQELDTQNDSVTKEYDVSTPEAFAAAVDEINSAASGTYVIRLQADITLSGDISLRKNTTTILGEGHSLSGGSNQALGANGSAVLNLGSNGYNKSLTFKGAQATHTCLSISDTATVNLYDGVTIQDYASFGGDGAVSMSGTSIFNMFGGVIENCKDKFSQTTGGVGVGSASDDSTDSCTFHMYGGVIRNCSGGYGGGVRVGKGGTFTMSDGEISGNTGTWGGGVYATQAKEVNISGGKITGNAGTYGGGLSVTYMKDSLTSFFHYKVLLSGGEITGNTATYGGGISLYNSNTAQPVKNITVIGNTAQVGGGIILWNNSAMDVSDSSNIICNNTATAGAADVFLNKNEDSIKLPAAADMNQIYQTTGKAINGWYQDDPRYTPSPDGTAVDVSGTLKGELALVASYKVIPSHTVTVHVTDGAAYDNAACTGTPITEAEEGSTVYLKYTGSNLFRTWSSDPADLTIANADNAAGASFVMPASDITITADISALYTVTLPEGVTDVTATEGTVTGNTVSAPEGAKITFKKPADADVIYKIGDTELTPDENGVYTVTVGIEDIIVTAEKVQKPEPTPEPETKADILTKDDTVAITTRDASNTVVHAASAGAKIYLSYELADLPEGRMFEAWKVTAKDNTLVEVKTEGTRYYFIMPDSAVTVELITKPVNEEPDSPVQGDGALATIAGAATMTAAFGAAGYLVGTQAYLESIFGYVPANRQALALALWEKAGEPEPVHTALYTDVSSEETDAQKADRWCVEQGLLPDKGEDTFEPADYVTRVQVIRSWNALRKLLNNN